MGEMYAVFREEVKYFGIQAFPQYLGGVLFPELPLQLSETVDMRGFTLPHWYLKWGLGLRL